MLQFALTLLVGMGVQGLAEKPAGWDDPWAAGSGEAGEAAPPDATLQDPRSDDATAAPAGAVKKSSRRTRSSTRASKARKPNRSTVKASRAPAGAKAAVLDESAVTTARVAKTPRPPKKTPIRKHRKRSSDGNAIVGWVVPDDHLRVTPLPRPSGNLHLFVLATKEQVKVNIYNPDGSYNVEALDAISNLLRCKRTDARKAIEPRLASILSHVYDHFGERRIEVISGFRNQRRMTSYHYKGSATDIRVDGVKPKVLQAYAESLDAGGMGVGIYPRTGFVHVDVRPRPSYRWVDYSRSDPNAPAKRPPRTWKKKKLQS